MNRNYYNGILAGYRHILRIYKERDIQFGHRKEMSLEYSCIMNALRELVDNVTPGNPETDAYIHGVLTAKLVTAMVYAPEKEDYLERKITALGLRYQMPL